MLVTRQSIGSAISLENMSGPRASTPAETQDVVAGPAPLPKAHLRPENSVKGALPAPALHKLSDAAAATIPACNVTETAAVNAADKAEVDPTLPAYFRSALSNKPLTDPVSLTDGNTYDRQEVEEHFAAHGATSPLTGEALPKFERVPQKLIIVNKPLRTAMQERLAHIERQAEFEAGTRFEAPNADWRRGVESLSTMEGMIEPGFLYNPRGDGSTVDHGSNVFDFAELASVVTASMGRLRSGIPVCPETRVAFSKQEVFIPCRALKQMAMEVDAPEAAPSDMPSERAFAVQIYTKKGAATAQRIDNLSEQAQEENEPVGYQLVAGMTYRSNDEAGNFVERHRSGLMMGAATTVLCGASNAVGWGCLHGVMQCGIGSAIGFGLGAPVALVLAACVTM